MLFRAILALVCAATAAAASAVSSSDTSVTWVSIGDWGGAAIGGRTLKVVNAVSSTLSDVVQESVVDLVLNTGDSFYYCGILSVDDPTVQRDWLTPFQSPPELRPLPWFSVLGNHEYGLNVSAVLALHHKYASWVMPARYYSHRVTLSASASATVIFLDTSPCVTEYRSPDSKGWDPCGGNYPTCAGGGNANAECKFHANIVAQQCTAQHAWLQAQLAAVPATDWLIVVGHHAADEVTEFDLVGMLEASKVDLYVNGHTHALAHYSVNGNPMYVTSGAGSLDPLGPAKVNVSALSPAQQATHAKAMGASGTFNSNKYSTVFSQRVAGFVLHRFSPDFKSLTSEFMEVPSGKTLHSFTVQAHRR